VTGQPIPRPRADRVILDHARPPVVTLLRDLGLRREADDLANAPSLSALRYVAATMRPTLRTRIRLRPLRRATISAVSALHGATLLGLRGDTDNAAVMALGVFTNVAHARAWRRRWWQLPRWKQVRARVLAQARAEQTAYLAPDESAPVDLMNIERPFDRPSP
jgi:hypothetical protein